MKSTQFLLNQQSTNGGGNNKMATLQIQISVEIYKASCNGRVEMLCAVARNLGMQEMQHAAGTHMHTHTYTNI